MFQEELSAAGLRLQNALRELGIPAPQEVAWSPTPQAGEWGFGTPAAFQAAAAEARAGKKISVSSRAEEIARQLVAKLETMPGFERMESVGGYVNLYIDAAQYVRRVVDTAIEQGEDFGRGAPKRERVMVEYVQPNTHHSFHIGHARTAILGESLARIVSFAGFETLRASYPGDIGLGVITCLWAYQKFYAGKEPQDVHERGQWLGRIYSEATAMLQPTENETPQETAAREARQAEVRDLYRRWDEGDPQVRQLWLTTRQWSLDELDAILALLGIHIDVFFFESEVDELAKEIVEELIALGIAEDERPSGGPVVVKIDEKLGLKEEKYRTAVILRSDGTTLYLTKDLALAKRKFEEYHIDRSIYVVDVRQSLHFQQVFKILELWGFPQAKKCYHLAYGFVTLPEGAMSSRKGNIVLFMDVYHEACRRVREIISEKNPDLTADQRQKVAEQVGLGALAYTMLGVDTTKDIVFDWDRALDFEGQAAPYIQYAHVRASSILKRVDALPGPFIPQYNLESAEVALLERISHFPDIIQRAASDYKPLILVNYAYDLARDFTDFYASCPVLQADEERRAARIRLTAAARQTLANSLRLLTIQAPEVM
jgi:arginyl-tRNA synthetase